MIDLYCVTHGHRVVSRDGGSKTTVSPLGARIAQGGRLGAAACAALLDAPEGLAPGPVSDTARHRGCVLEPTRPETAKALRTRQGVR